MTRTMTATMSSPRIPTGITKITVAVAAALAVTLPAPGSVAAQAPDAAPEPPPDIVVEVDGLSCPFCAYGIEKKFVEREEVDSVFVELEENEVRLWLKPDHELADEAVRETVDEAGFTPGRIRRPSEEGGGAG